MRRLVPLALCVLAAAVVAFSAACGDDGGGKSAPAASASSTRATATATTAPLNVQQALDAFLATKIPADQADGAAAGNKDAKVTLTVFEDFQCPVCLRYSLISEPTIIQEYVLTGKIRYEVKSFPILGQESGAAAIAATCAAKQNRFWDYHAKLFAVEAQAGQLTKEQNDVGRFAADKLTGYAQDLGLDMTAFNACTSGTGVVDEVSADVSDARTLGLRGTPSFLINGQPLATYPANPAGWRKLLDEALK